MRSVAMICASLLVCAVTANAQDLTTGHLASLDTTGDGTVDKTEYEAFITRAFTTMDKNGDGYVTLTEATAVGLTPELFAQANTNGDGGISAKEFATQAAADFATADKDGNGLLQ